MDKNALLNELSHFLKTESACVQSVATLNSQAEIGINVAETFYLTVKNEKGEVDVKPERPINADFIFTASPSAIEILINEKGLSAGGLGVKLIKQIVSGDIKVSMPANLFQISSRGYLNILKLGGMDFLNELKKHDLTSVPKIMTALRKLKKK